MSARKLSVRQSREARGFHARLCRQCSRGIAAGEVKLFDPRCEGCAEKKARGLRTGDEPRPAFRAGSEPRGRA